MNHDKMDRVHALANSDNFKNKILEYADFIRGKTHIQLQTQSLSEPVDTDYEGSNLEHNLAGSLEAKQNDLESFSGNKHE